MPTSLISGPRFGYAPHDLRVVYRGNVHRGLVRFNRVENAWIVSPSATTEQQLGRLRRWVRTLPPFFLYVYPSSLFTFIDLLGEAVRACFVAFRSGVSSPDPRHSRRVSRRGLSRSSEYALPTGTGTANMQRSRTAAGSSAASTSTLPTATWSCFPPRLKVACGS